MVLVVFRLFTTSGTLLMIVERPYKAAENPFISIKTRENTSKPVTTVADTSKPVTTVADTSKPVTTVADTSKPVATVADTSKPVTTVADASKPVTTVADASKPVIIVKNKCKPVSSTCKPISNVTRTRFAVCTSFWEQQTNAVINFWSFQKWAKVSGYKVFEPFVYQSKLGVTDPILNTCDVTNSFRFRDYFDLNLWTNTTNKKFKVPPFEQWDAFACSPFKKTVVVLLIYWTSPTGEFVDDDIDKHPGCRKEREDFYVKHTKLFNKLELQVIRNVCLVLGRVTLKHFNSFLFPEKDDVNVWFADWRGIWRIQLSDHPELGRGSEGMTKVLAMIETSPSVLNDTRKYVNTILNSTFKEYTAIVVRTSCRANLLIDSGHSRNVVMQMLWNCLEDLRVVLRRIPSDVKVLCIDLGRFGDLSTYDYFKIDDDGNKLFNAALKMVYGNKSIDEYENEFLRVANGIEDSGYIGSMQKAIAENAKKLIVVGGKSSFQQSLVQNFKAKNGNCQTCVIRVCH